MKTGDYLPDVFGLNVFGEETMRQYLTAKDFDDLQQTIRNHESLKAETAEAVAEAMKKWAVSRGATHYTHWFQPMTNVTAEKQDSFISIERNGRMIMEFSAKNLMKGETDASSFPSGGLRATFEARGYTAWDCTSPAFLKEDAGGITLCIPTAFCSFTGDSLDKKTPLLRSMQALDQETVRLLRLLGNKTVKHAVPCAGAEQEYFLVDRDKFLAREDMILTGRTLFGAPAPKDQELDDHYFGSIRERIGSFMKDLNEALWKMGVPAKTQHNEAAPAQHELVSIYSEANITTDQNQIVMDTLKRVAYRHGLHCLLHEKPFEGINGSGKHNNWSLITDDGTNLLEPGSTPHENSQFLLIFACILKAVDQHADLLRASTACPGNDSRLGAMEAPPAIISAFVGEQMEDVLQQYILSGEATHSLRGHHLKTGVATLPNFVKDATDRNRTSPFAFTGNKFEFRMVGSSDSVAAANTVINTIIAEAFADASEELEKAEDIPAAVHRLIGKYAAEHKRIIFSGNSYSEDWVREAERRGLPNLPGMVDAIPAITKPENQALFERFHVYNRSELAARAEIKYETYVKTMRIEARTMIDMVNRQIMPAVLRYKKELAETLVELKSTGLPMDCSVEENTLYEVTEQTAALRNALDDLRTLLHKAEAQEGMEKQGRFYRDRIVPAMKALRKPADKLELLVRRELWPFPTYLDLLFEV